MVSLAMSEVGAREDRGRLRIEEYALLGDTHTAALVGANGSIDWLCLPRFDSGACFAALLGGEKNGFWQIAPVGGYHRVSRRYRGESLVLETEFHTAEGIVRVVDCMPRRVWPGQRRPGRRGISGRVPMRMDLVMRFDYGWIVPWMRRVGEHLHGVAGPDFVCLATPVETRGENFRTIVEFSVAPAMRFPSCSRGTGSIQTRPAVMTRPTRWPRPKIGGGSGASGAPFGDRGETPSFARSSP